MRIDKESLIELMIDLVAQKFGSNEFKRRELMILAEQTIRERGLWSERDDLSSNSADGKSLGLASIDYAFSDITNRGLLASQNKHGYWKVVDEGVEPEASLQASNLQEPPERFQSSISKVARDAQLARDLKVLYRFSCQVCGLQIRSGDGSFYIEAHHVRPLGGPHLGSDSHGNMIVLCPNHHAMFDLGIPYFESASQIWIGKSIFQLQVRHEILRSSISYHNSAIYKPA